MFILQRIAQAVLVIALAYTLVFFTLFVLPGNPIENKLNNPQNPLPESAAAPLLAYYGLDRSIGEQFLLSVQRLFQGDLGFSIISGRPVTELIAQGAASTISLSLTALVFTLVISLAVSLTAVFSPIKAVRGFARALPLFFLSTPSFLVGFCCCSSSPSNSAGCHPYATRASSVSCCLPSPSRSGSTPRSRRCSSRE